MEITAITVDGVGVISFVVGDPVISQIFVLICPIGSSGPKTKCSVRFLTEPPSLASKSEMVKVKLPSAPRASSLATPDSGAD